jgi:hypothetical protein
VPDDESIKQIGFSFSTLNDIKALEKTKAIDLICVVCKVDELTVCTLKNGQ